MTFCLDTKIIKPMCENINNDVIFTADGIFKILRNRGKKDPSY